MGSYGDQYHEIPAIDLSKISPDQDVGTQEWKHLCKRVREASENYGCFEVVYDKISIKSKAEAFSLMRPLFDLPMEIKRKNTHPIPLYAHIEPSPIAPLLESFGIDDASNYESVKDFAEKFVAHDHEHFCQSMCSLTKQMDVLTRTISMLTCDSLGLDPKEMESSIMFKTLVHLSKYSRPPPGEAKTGLAPHTDKPMSTLLFQDEVSGLEIQTKDGQWIKWNPSPTSFMYFIGDLQVAWSNKRVLASNHRVMICGDKERFSLAIFLFPLEGTLVNPPKELVDEDHPQFIKDFDIVDYMTFCNDLSRTTTTIPISTYLYEYAAEKKRTSLLQ